MTNRTARSPSRVSCSRGMSESRLRIVAAALALLVSTSGAAQSSIAFKQNVILESSPTSILHFVSLPFVYTPPDVGTIGTLDAEDLCQDLDGVAAVLRWDEPSSTFVEHQCGDASPFGLSQGVGYAVRLPPNFGIRSALSGGHDDAFAYSIPPSGGSQLAWLSVPYHVRIPEKHGDSRVTAEDLCRQIGLAEVAAILRWNRELGAYEAYACGSTFQEPFQLARGEGYGVINLPNETIDWQPIHY